MQFQMLIFKSTPSPSSFLSVFSGCLSLGVLAGGVLSQTSCSGTWGWAWVGVEGLGGEKRGVR